MLRLLKQYQDIIQEWRIIRYDREVNISRLKASLKLKDGSCLFIKDYRFNDGSRKYAFHWVDRDNNLIIRWDNATHWPGVATHPHHKHIKSETNVEISRETDLSQILAYISFKRRFSPE